jgi:hypothetical protein
MRPAAPAAPKRHPADPLARHRTLVRLQHARSRPSSGDTPGPPSLTWTLAARYFSRQTFTSGRGSQVVRQRSAKPLYIGSTPIRASSLKRTQPTVLQSLRYSREAPRMFPGFWPNPQERATTGTFKIPRRVPAMTPRPAQDSENRGVRRPHIRPRDLRAAGYSVESYWNNRGANSFR